MRRLYPVLILTALLPLAACGDDRGGDDGGGGVGNQEPGDCTPDEVYNQVLRRCLPRGQDGGTVDDTDASPGEDVAEDAVDAAPDVPGEDVEEDVLDPSCDVDRDGVASMACGGDDCDDDDFFRAPGRDEICDDKDNNCNGQVNEGIGCVFYAHTGEMLYAVDPFALTAAPVGTVPNLQDIDTHPDGTLYGVTREELYRFSPQERQWIKEGNFPSRIEDANGLAIDSAGVAYVTSGDSMYEVNLETADTSLIGVVGPSFYSSGDCVVNKRDSLFMTSKTRDQPDTLVLVDRQTGQGTAIGEVGFSRVFGLTAGWGTLYGLTSNGELISIDASTGQGTLLHTFEGLMWFGAASTPSR